MSRLVGASIAILVFAYALPEARQRASGSPPPPAFVSATTPQSEEAARIGMVVVPAGAFIAGATPGQPGEKLYPARTVTLRAFLIDRTEVTNAAYRQFVLGAPQWRKGAVSGARANPSYLSHFTGNELAGAKPTEPVAWVSWFAAQAYCESVGKRLPTSAEWEKAARGTDGRLYPWGTTLDGTRANYCDAKCGTVYHDRRGDDGFDKLAPVGSFPRGASPYGALDMSGNVLEWVNDWRDTTGAYYRNMPVANPRGPEAGRLRVLRGGSWLHNEAFIGVNTIQYFAMAPTTTAEYIGFRCAKDIGQ